MSISSRIAAALLIAGLPAAAHAVHVTAPLFDTSGIYRFDVWPTDRAFGPTHRPIPGGNGFTWDAEAGIAVLDYQGNYGLGGLFGNGTWDGRRDGFAGTNHESAKMSFTFDQPTQAVGGLVNYLPSFVPHKVMMRIYGAGDVMLESIDIAKVAPISTPDGQNEGSFHGFSRAAPDIVRLELQGSYVVIDDLAIGRLAASAAAPLASVPLPVTGPLLAFAVGVLAMTRRRRAAN